MSDQVLPPAAAARAAIRADLTLIDDAQARLRAADTDLVGNAFRVEMAEHLETQHRVNRGLSYRIFGEIADPADGPDDPRLPADTKIADLLWSRLRITRAEVRRRFRIAARIRPRRKLTGPPTPPELPDVAAAVEDGRIGDDHIKSVTAALDQLPAHVAPADREAAERTLVRHATEQDAAFVTIMGHAIADVLNPDGNFTDEDRARRRNLVLGRQGPDGMSRLSGCIDPETRAYLEAVMAAVRPGHRRPGNSEERDTRSSGQRDHDALKLALRHSIESGSMGTHRGVPVTVIVTTKLADLDQATRAMTDPDSPMPAPARTGGGSRLPMRDLIRMAANSIHYLAVFDNHSERPLYLGRSKRIATLDHRIICHARDRGCTRPNCTEPGYHCEVHHSTDWAHDGRTNADELYFACGGDHGAATRGDLQTHVTEQGRLAWTDGTGPPQINHLHHPEELLDDVEDP
ncbi:HNH endonuclease [Mycolicibacter heraklionensis]|uniref:HNH endonuclease n=1 Tax=Mycolicibacter heraklionensis TaxID=512402 RepID=A0A9X7WKK6_9MYCO|nr:HNH endonuclease signature motif containing protein [Mycolicibacter heraklionensis]QZA09342.1 HNH endonuclease [Mycolicibacter heraklionensis]